MQPFEILRDVKSGIGYMLRFPDSNYTVVLAQDTATQLVIPEEAQKGVAVFYPQNGGDFYVSAATFALPTGGSFSASAICFNLPGVWLNGETSLFFRAPAAMRLGVAFYSRAA